MIKFTEVGSSKSMSFEPPIKAIPTDNLRFCPPDRFLAKSKRFALKSTSSIIYQFCKGLE